MKRSKAIALAVGLSMALTSGFVYAQKADEKAGAGLTRDQVKMERDEFLRTHLWDSNLDTWSLKSGVEPPTGVKSRAEVRGERDTFLSANRWNQTLDAWEPVKGGPRDMSKMSHDQVRVETQQFLKTHEWDNQTSKFVEKKERVVKK
jgi:hypothetical protein